MGAQLGPFWLSRRLAGGRTGEVWSGVHGRQGVQVAVKFLTVGRNAAVRAVFEHEIEALASLDHPNIVRIWDHGTVPEAAAQALGGKVKAGAPYLVMEQGRATLGDRKQPLGWAGARTVALDLLAALGHAHARGMLHRDLKPANVLLCPAAKEGERHRVVLTDFGFAGASGEESLVVGLTPSYAAPEQLTFSARDEGPWTDLFALGCVVHALIAGQSPFEAQTVEEALARQARAVPRLPGVEPTVEAWIRELLAIDPFARPASAAEATERLLRAEGGPKSVAVAFPADWRREEARVDGPGNLSGAGLGLVGIRSGSVGHDAVRDELWQALRRAAEGTPQAVILRGAEGIGKTHLGRWLGRTGHELHGATELVVEGNTAGDGPTAAIRRRLAIDGLGWWEARQRIGAWLARTGGVGWLESRNVQKVLEPGPLTPELFGPTADLLRRCAFGRPVVVRIDDAHHLPEVLAFVAYVLAERRDPRVLFLLTVRDDEVRARPDVARAIADLVRAGASERLIGELRGGDNDRFVAQHLGLAPDLRGAVARVASGNPGLTRRLLRRYASAGGLEVDEDGAWRRTGGADVEIADEDLHLASALVDGFLAQRPEADRHALELAAVLGRDVRTADLELALRRATVLRSQALYTDLVGAGLWQAAEGGWSFVDGRVARALERGAQRAGRLDRWHGVAAEVLDGQEGAANAARRARHLVRAGRAAEAIEPWKRGLKARLDEQPPSTTADELAALERAIAALRPRPEDPLNGVAEALHAELWLVAGEVERARRVAQALAHRASESDASGSPPGKWPDARSVAWRVLAALRLEALELEEAMVRVETAMEAAPTGESQAAARIVLGAVHLAAGRPEVATAALRDAARAARDQGRIEGDVLLAQAALYLALDREDDAGLLVDRAAGLVSDGRLREARGRVLLVSGEVARARDELRAARAAYREAGQPELSRRVELPLSSARLASGGVAGAVAGFRAASESGSAAVRAAALAGLIAAAAVEGDRAALDQRLGAWSRLPRVQGVVLPDALDLLALGAAALRKTDPDRAKALSALAGAGLRPLGREGEAVGKAPPRLAF